MQPYELLERKWAEWNRLDPAGMVVCSSGTAALHLALEAIPTVERTKRGETAEVIMSDYNMIAVPRAASLAGFNLSFADCGAGDTDASINLNEYDRNFRSVAVVPVHVYGRTCDVPLIQEQAEARFLYVIEDLAEAHGVKPDYRSDAACWSFYKNKIVAGEEGGAVWFRDPKHAVIARELRSLGFTPDHDYRHRPRGHNYRLSNCHAELILKSLDKVGDNIKRREDGVGWMDEFLPKEWRQPPRDANWVYDLRIPGLKRNQMTEIVQGLNNLGVGARHGFYPMTGQEEFFDRDGPKKHPNAWLAADEVFYLPIPFTRQTAQEMIQLLQQAVALVLPDA